MAHVEPELIESAIDDTLADYAGRPRRYRRRRGLLLAWLATAVKRRILDSLRTMTRSRRREVRIAGDDRARDRWVDLPEPSDRDVLRARRRALLGVANTLAEKAFIVAKLRGLPPERQVQAMGVRLVDQKEAQALANRMWNRIEHRVKRLRKKTTRRARGSGSPPGGPKTTSCPIWLAASVCLLA